MPTWKPDVKCITHVRLEKTSTSSRSADCVQMAQFLTKKAKHVTGGTLWIVSRQRAFTTQKLM